MYKDKSVLNSIAQLAVEGYFEKKASLNDSLKKLASSEHLTPVQVQYVAAEANKGVWQKLFGMDKTASYDFPLADAQTIIESLALKHEAPKVDLDAEDYLAPPATKLASFDPFKAIGVVSENLEKTASAEAKKHVKRELEYKYEKLAHVREEILTKQYECGTRVDNAEREFVKAAREMVLEQPLDERGAAFAKIASFVHGVTGNVEYKVNLMRKLAHVLTAQGLVKKADMKAPEEYISESLPAQIVNGVHPLYITIKTVLDGRDEYRSLGDRYEIVDGSLPVIKEKIRAL